MSEDAGVAPPRFTTIKEYLKQLNRYMEANDISRGDLARALGMDERSQVSRWLNGRVEPRLSTIEKIDRAIAKIEKGRKSR